MELAKIIKYLDKKFNEKIAADWDNTGLQNLDDKSVEHLDDDIQKIIICLDVNQEVINQAINQQVNLIISRHPFLFGELITERKFKKDLIKQLVKNNIVIYSIHTNYDASPNQNLIALLETKFAINKVKRIGLENEGYEVKLKAPISSKDFLNKMGDIFPSEVMELTKNFDFESKVKSFGIVTGAGGSTLIETQFQNSYFVTGEMKWHEMIYANDNQVSVLLLGHYMENYFVDHLTNILSENFKELSIIPINIGNQTVQWTRKE